jgi:hypothetical protein
VKLRAVEFEGDPVANSDVEGHGGLLTWSYKVVTHPFVSENPAREGMKIVGGTTGTAPTQKLGQMQKFVLENPLQCLESIVADQAADKYITFDILERAEQQRG